MVQAQQLGCSRRVRNSCTDREVEGGSFNRLHVSMHEAFRDGCLQSLSRRKERCVGKDGLALLLGLQLLISLLLPC
eukprot:765504-Hanusia_phi.AAC.2